MTAARTIFTSRAKCATCHQRIAFYKLPNGLWCPCNPDGSDHFDDCRQAWFKEVQRDGTPFELGSSEGYYFKGREVLTKITSLRVVGKDYKPSACQCLPWDDCSCGSA